jgi:hypothetical protein
MQCSLGTYCTLSQINLFHVLATYLKIHPNIIVIDDDFLIYPMLATCATHVLDLINP